MELPIDDLPNSTNINTRWLDNIYENIKNIEAYQKLAMNGCRDLMEFLKISPEQRYIEIGEVQYKNLKFMANELKIVLPDIGPVIEAKEIEKMKADLSLITSVIEQRDLFIEVNSSEVTGKILSTKLKPYYTIVLNKLINIREDLIMMLKHVLYIRDDKPKW